ncbi:MAG: hypothetical protein ABW000_20685 [Actinoplanes sp.]
MRRRPSLFLIALTTAVSLAAGIASPALAAAPATMNMSFNAAPEPVTKGAIVTLTGRVWLGDTGNRTTISFYFRRAGTSSSNYVYKGFVTTTDSGAFTRRYQAETTGTWKAVYAGSASRKNTARLDHVQVVQRRAKQIASHKLTHGDWQSANITIPERDYRAVVTYRCKGDGFLYLYWKSKNTFSEHANSSKSSDTLILNGHAGNRTGYFEVSTWLDCSWNLKVFSGVVTTQV